MSGDKGMFYGEDDPLQSRMFQPPPNGHEFDDPVRLKEFVESGKAIITLYSQETTKHYTYKITAKGVGVWWVRCRGTNDRWDYLGAIVGKGSIAPTAATTPEWARSAKYQAFSWFHRRLIAGRIPPKLIVYHEGRCGMCGTVLTDPDSIRIGFGPECRKKKFRRPPIA